MLKLTSPLSRWHSLPHWSGGSYCIRKRHNSVWIQNAVSRTHKVLVSVYYLHGWRLGYTTHCDAADELLAINRPLLCNLPRHWITVVTTRRRWIIDFPACRAYRHLFVRHDTHSHRAIVGIRLHPGPVLPPGEPVWVYATVTNPCYSLLCHYCVVYSWPLRTNTTSSTKPEVHNISQRPQRRTEPRTYR